MGIKRRKAVTRKVLADRRHARGPESLHDAGAERADRVGVEVQRTVADGRAGSVVEVEHRREAEIDAVGGKLRGDDVGGAARRLARRLAVAVPEPAELSHRRNRRETFAKSLYSPTLVVDAERQRRRAQEFFQLPGKLQHRLSRRKILHPHALPAGRRVDAGAERLGESLLGGEALGEVGGGQAVVLESAEFGFGKNASRKALSEARQGMFDARDLDYVGAYAVDHRTAWIISCFISRTASRMPTNTARLTMAWPMCSSRTPGSLATGSTLK